MSDTERKHVSKPAPVRRFEVFTGAGRRRKWSAETKAEIVAESHVGGETVCSVARRHGLTPQQLFAWRRQARQNTRAAPGALVSFAPVVVEEEAATAPTVRRRQTRRAAAGAPPMIEVTIVRTVIRVPRAADAAALAAIVRAVKAAP